MLSLTQDNFVALGRELVNAHIARFAQALVDHASTVDEPAPTDHPLIERIVKQHGGQYVVQQPGVTPIGDRITAVEAAVAVATRVTNLEKALGLTPASGATVADRIAAIETAAASKLA